ncbi:MAG: UV DNA damage repair endonuclease UvsE [Thermoguttaceae bacterium]|jgi:UV DNA damage endonuclease
MMIRLGLCCIFRDEPIKFRTTTATATKRLSRDEGRKKLADLCAANAQALLQALRFCSANGIGCFRVNSQILPLKTHPEVGYDLVELPGGRQIVNQFRKCGAFAKSAGLRTTFHPDQFVVLNSPRPDVVTQSIQEIEYQAEVAQWIGADVVIIHGGGAYGDKQAALQTFAKNFARLSKKARKLVTLENDARVFTPADLLPLCKAEGLPLVYDVHHHRCNPDGMSVEQATKRALATWDREPLFHISSPIEGWNGPKPHRHHDFIDVKDFPKSWRRKKITVEVEAKAKEVALEKLLTELRNKKKTDGSWFVYLLRCADGSLYTGITNDVPRRLKQHNAGTASRYTRSRLPVVLAYQETQATRSHALKRELAIKALSRQEKESMIRAAGPTALHVRTK